MSQFIEMVGDPRNNPKGWPTKRLSELAEYSIGLTYKPEQICDDGTIVLRSGNIQDGKISFSDIVRVNAPIKESLFVKEDDILMCSRNGSASLVGKVAMIPDINEPMTFGAFMTIIRSAEAKYLYLYFQSQDFRERVSEGKSSTMNQITQKMLDKVEVPFPDKDVRETLSAIASQADKSKFGDFKSQFIEMFGGESNKVPFEEIVVVKDDCRRPINEGVRSEMKDGELYPYYGATGVVDYINDYLTDDELLCIAEDCGNYNAGEESAYIIRGKAWVNNHAHLVKTKEACDVKYLYYFLKIADLKPYVSGTTRLKLTQKKLKKISVTLPSTDKQKTFVKIAEQADKSKSVIQKALVYLNDIQSDELGKIA